MRTLIQLFFLSLLSISTYGQDWSLERSVQTSAVIQVSPPTITLNWVSQPANGFVIYKRTKGDSSWGIAIATVDGTVSSYEDTEVTVGANYEYRIVKDASIGGFGFINAGIEIPLVEQRGRLILVIDDTHSAALVEEINRLISDIEGDGWAVSKLEVSPMDAVTAVKAEIMDIYNTDINNFKAILLLGHVPVPYAGVFYPDGHEDHEGAWPADLYYGEMDGNWTDASVNSTVATNTRNHNTPGDGKFDQTIIPSDVDLQVARVDFFNLPAFAETETELLKKYLDKNHAFRNKAFTAEPRGLLENNFGGLPEGFGQNAYRNFTTMFGPDGVDVVDYSTMKTESYMWSYGAGGGNYTSANGIITTAELATDSLQSVFCMLFGSYFGDWDSENNLLRSSLASGTVLTNAWAGRPKFQFEHMALGENIGYGVPLTQNTPTNYVQDTCFGGRLVHVSLMGDPTLRMHIVEPPGENLTLTESFGHVIVEWTASSDADLGYHIYRKEEGETFFERVNEEPVEGLSYTIDCVDPGVNYTYMIRALRLETSASGSYYNLSQGVMGDFTLVLACLSATSEIEDLTIELSPIPSDDYLQVNLSAPVKEELQLQLLNANGQSVLEQSIGKKRTVTLSTEHLPAGMYLLLIRNESGRQSSKKIIII